MNNYFNIEDKIYDITEKYPETIDVFVSGGFEQFKDDNMRKIMGKSISLETVCKTKKINLDIFVEKLVCSIEQTRKSEDTSLIEKEKVQGDIRIDGVLPCPIRMPLLEGFNSWLDKNKNDFGFNVDYELKSANLGLDWIKDRLKTGDENQVSDLFMSAGFDLFFDRELMGQYKEKGLFEDITGLEKLNKDFCNEDIDLRDPLKQYSIIGVVPAVFMVNTEELGDRPMPKTWEDLLSPEFENSVSIPMRDLDLFNAILLNVYKNFGEDGVNKLGKSLLRSMHPAEMVKSHIKKTNTTVPIVTIMPYFFTKMVRSQSPLQSVWPEDGAIISPIFLLAKKTNKEKVKPFVDFFYSKEIGEIFSSNGKFPSTNPYIDNGLEENQKFMWLGWDFINNNDIGNLIKHCEDIFKAAI